MFAYQLRLAWKSLLRNPVLCEREATEGAERYAA